MRGGVKRLVALGAVAALTTGCAAAVSEVTGPEKNATYDTIEELREAAVEAGVDCPDWNQTDQMRHAAASGDCSDEVVLSIYSSQGALDNQLEYMIEGREEMEELLGDDTLFDDDEPVLVGPNWIINAPNPEQVQEELGGTLQKW